MKFYIEVENGVPKNHPASEANLLDAFTQIPPNWEPFVRVPMPVVYGKRPTTEKPTYQKIDGVWTDFWELEDFSPEEKAEIVRQKRVAWEKHPNYFNFTAWTFNESTGEFEPPIARPTDTDINYRWCGAENSWKEAPLKPSDGNSYKFDFVAWQWMPFTE